MSGHDDYLWTKAGRDREIERLERLLAPYAHRPHGLPPAWRADRGSPGPRPARRARTTLALAATLAVCALAVTLLLQHRLAWPDGEAWQVLTTTGEVRWQDGPTPGRLAPGGEIVTGEQGRARLRVARIGELWLGADSRLRLEETRSGRHRVRLLQGRLRARVWAPPLHFGVRLPGAEALDLGCEFVVESDAAGNGALTVLSGWVLVDAGSGEVLVPRGATVPLRRGAGAGTPRDLGASAAFVAALQAIDARGGRVPPAGEQVRRLIAASRPQDAISLLTLLQRRPELAQGPLYDRLVQLLPDAPPVAREAIVRRTPAALDPWWDALPYPRAKRWWLQWPDALPATGTESG